MSVPGPYDRSLNMVVMNRSRIDRRQTIRRAIRQIDALNINTFGVELLDYKLCYRAVTPLAVAEVSVKVPITFAICTRRALSALALHLADSYGKLNLALRRCR